MYIENKKSNCIPAQRSHIIELPSTVSSKVIFLSLTCQSFDIITNDRVPANKVTRTMTQPARWLVKKANKMLSLTNLPELTYNIYLA